MKDLFITKSTVDYAAGLTGGTSGTWDLASLTEGAIAIFDGDGLLLDGISPSITTNKFSIALATAEGFKQSILFDRDNFTYQKLAYVAPVAAVKFIGSDTAGSAGSYSLNLPTSLVAGDVLGVTITDVTKRFDDLSRMKTYTYTVVTGDIKTGTGASNIITKLVAVINADPNCIVTALALTDGTNNDGIKFTANTAGNEFMIGKTKSMGGVTNILENADIVEYGRVNNELDAASVLGTQNNPGQGTAAWLTALETEMSVRDGNTNSLNSNSLYWKVTSKVASAGTYTTYFLTMIQADDDVMIRENNPMLQVVIACPSGDTASGESIFALDNILAVL